MRAVSEADALRKQYADAERLVREAQQAAEEATAGDVPPRGWATPGDRPPSPLDLAQLAALLESLRGLVPPELVRQLADALRELLIALRAVVDWYIARLEPDDRGSTDVQDIPVE
jgi:hypothetical protein